MILLTLYRRRAAWAFAFAMLIFLLSFYIFQISSLTATAYRMADYEENREIMKQEIASLERIYVTNSSFTTLEELAANHSFQKITTIVYARVGKGSVAQDIR